MPVHSCHQSNPLCRTHMMRQKDWKCLIHLNVLVVCLAFAAFLVYKIHVCNINYRHPYLLHSLSSQSQLLYAWLSDTNPDVLHPEAPPFSVHYLWCRKGHFELIHYLSLLSVVKVAKPDQIVFHYTHLPATDSKGYVTWFEDIQRDIPFLSFKKISHSQYCGHKFFENSDFALADYDNPTGVFMSDDVAVVNLTRSDFLKVVKSAKEKWKKVRVFLLPASEPYVISENSAVQVMKCPTLQEYNRAAKHGIYADNCVQLTDRLSAFDIWHHKTPFNSFARMLLFGLVNDSMESHRKSKHVPSHCHILHFTKSVHFDVTAYASVLSAFTVGKIEQVFVHSDQVPSGKLWEKLISNYNVTFVMVPHVTKWHPDIGDVVYGVYLLLHRGGIVTRSDTIWRKEIPWNDINQETTVVSIRRSIYRIINYSLDLSVIISKPYSDFLQLLITTLRQTPKRHADAKSEEVAYRVYLETPHEVKLYTWLTQHVVCLNKQCRATPEDAGAGKAVVVQLDWKDGRPATETDLENYVGFGVSLIKAAIKHH